MNKTFDHYNTEAGLVSMQKFSNYKTLSGALTVMRIQLTAL